MFISKNPTTEEVIFTQDFITNDQLNGVLTSLSTNYFVWKKMSISERKTFLPALISYLEKKEAELALLITQEIGKPIAQSRGEIQKCVQLCKHYDAHIEEYLKEENIISENKISKLVFDPTGIILGVMPWNFPFWQVFRFVVPTILAGNVVLLKHAPNAGLCGLELEKIFHEIGLKAFYSNVFIDHTQCEEVLKFKTVAGVSLTGSTSAGASIAALASKYLKPQVLELGGSDVFIVDEHVKIEEVAEQALIGRLQNNGQSCIAAKRFLIHENVYETFKNTLINLLQTKIIGDPFDESIAIGPLARKDLKDSLEAQLLCGVEQGAKLLYRNNTIPKTGFFTSIDVYEVVDAHNSLFKEEVFGPAFVLKSVKNIDEAIAIANDSDYGLSASFWSDSEIIKDKVCKEIESGAVFINKISRSESGLPFGGIKQSGWGKELGKAGARSFVNKKLIVG